MNTVDDICKSHSADIASPHGRIPSCSSGGLTPHSQMSWHADHVNTYSPLPALPALRVTVTESQSTVYRIRVRYSSYYGYRRFVGSFLDHWQQAAPDLGPTLHLRYHQHNL